jgi:rhamnulokinase
VFIELATDQIHVNGSMRWPLQRILHGLEDGFRKAAERSSEGIASVAVDGWAVDYVRLDSEGLPLADPYCYRDERTVASKQSVGRTVSPEWMFRHTGAQPLRIDTVYQLLADVASGHDPRSP